MEIDRRGLFIGLAATAAVAMLPALPASAVFPKGFTGGSDYPPELIALARRAFRAYAKEQAARAVAESLSMSSSDA